MTRIIGIIPARYHSTRLPAKPLALIGTKSMIQHVYEQCCKSKLLNEVVVATDDTRIVAQVQLFGGQVYLTSKQHESGTERCAELASILKLKDSDYVVNIQGDEPFINPKQIDNLCSNLVQDKVAIATQVKQIDSETALFDVNLPKVVLNGKNEALYFSRQTIPFLRDVPKEDYLTQHTFYQHIGIYAYRNNCLQAIAQLAPHPLEQAEKLEQLRWLANNYTIKVYISPYHSFSVDTPEDLEMARKIYHKYTNS